MRLLLVSSVVAIAGLALLPYVIPLPGREPWPGRSPFPDGRMVEVCGTRWHLRSWPAGIAARGRVVLIHGFGGSSFSWRLTGPAVADAGFDAIAVDLPPWGYSERRRPRRPVAECLVELLDRIGGRDPVIPVGHSMGAAVAAALAERLGSRAPALVLVDGVPGRGGGRAGPLAILAVPPLSRVVEHFAYRRLLAPDRFAASLASAYGRPPSAEEVEGYLRPLRIAGTTPAVLRYGAHGARVERLPREVLLIWGRQDRWVPPAVAERFRARHPEARLAWIEEAGHNPMETHPRAFHDLLLAFLRERIPRAADGER